MNRILIIIALTLGLNPAFAASDTATSSLEVYTNLARNHAPGAGVSRRVSELQAAQIWLDTDEAPPIAGGQGEVLYAYGHSHPLVLCAPLNLCVVNLMASEKIISLSIGDSVRWMVQPSQAGDRPVVVIKPTVAGLRTNLVVTTDNGHVYYLDLVSDKADFIPMIGFYDPQMLVVKVNDQKALADEKARKTADTKVALLPGVTPDDLNFEYWWEGDKAIQPVRVFSSEGKVFIQMPSDMHHGDAPALFILEGGQEQLTNYRLAGSYFVVDQQFKEAHLVLGADSNRTTVNIHAGKKPFWSLWGSSN